MCGMNKFIKFRRSRGLTLIELLVAIGVSALIVVAAMSLWKVVGDQRKVKTELENIAFFTSAIKDFASKNRQTYSSGSYAYSFQMNNSLLISANLVPKRMLVPSNPTNGIKHSWTPTGLTSVQSQSLRLVGPGITIDYNIVMYYRLPRVACVELASRTFNVPDFDRVLVNNVQITSVPQVTSTCRDNDTNYIAWYIK